MWNYIYIVPFIWKRQIGNLATLNECHGINHGHSESIPWIKMACKGRHLLQYSAPFTAMGHWLSALSRGKTAPYWVLTITTSRSRWSSIHMQPWLASAIRQDKNHAGMADGNRYILFLVQALWGVPQFSSFRDIGEWIKLAVLALSSFNKKAWRRSCDTRTFYFK